MGKIQFPQIAISSSLFAPVILITAYILLVLFIRGSLPSSQEIVNHFAEIYARYGYEIIFISAILEALVMVNFFVPGMVAMAMGAVFARTGYIELTGVILTASCGLIIGYSIDYLLGYFGFGDFLKKTGYSWFLEKAKKEFNKFGIRGLILGFSYPNVGSFLSLAAGASAMNVAWFLLLAILSSAFWVSLWGLLIYALGAIFLTILIKYGFLVALTVLASIILLRVWRSSN